MRRTLLKFTVLCAVMVLVIMMLPMKRILRKLGLDPTAPDRVMVPMRDGVRLHTLVYKPGKAKYPVVLTRGYWPGFESHGQFFNAHGYVYVGQSTRGHGESEGDEGVSRRFLDDREDGYDTLEWISEQPWCDGNIAMYGKSYWASTQWHAAVADHPNLKAIVPQNTNPESFSCGYRTNGVLSLAMTARGRAYDKNDWKAIDEIGWNQYFSHLPLLTLDRIVGGASEPGSADLWRDYVRHTTYDDFWKSLTLAGEYEAISIPVFLMGGWYDYYPGAVLNAFVQLRQHGNERVRVVIDSSDHLNRSVGDRDFGDEVPKNELELAVRWLDHVLKGKDNGIEDEPPVQIFVMGINEWRHEDEWPLTRTSYRKYYFHSPGGSQHGSLNTVPPGDELPCKYIYDPENPVPTLGGNHSFADTSIPDIIRAGPVDQRPNEARSDVLVFTGEPLNADLEVIGPIEVKLFASSSARDTDFVVKLIDVYPNGTALNLTEGIVRARFRKSIWEPPELIVPGKIYEYSIELLPTSNVFKKGHRLRIHLTSSNFPHWERNLNTGNDPATDVVMEKAEQTVYHDRQHSSHIVLPIIPRQPR